MGKHLDEQRRGNEQGRGTGGNAASAVYENKLVSENIKNERKKLLAQWSNEQRRAMLKHHWLWKCQRQRLKICNKILFSALVKLGQGVCLQMGKVLRAACAASCWCLLLLPLIVVLFCGRQINFFSLSLAVFVFVTVTLLSSGAKRNTATVV